MRLAPEDAFHVYVIGFTSLIVLFWLAGAVRARRLRKGARRKAECPLCGRVTHPEPAVSRVKCRGCGAPFELKPEQM
ncbi:MAG: hypothetical protein IT577_21935 [Verrucomicrobiae bacterium]|nr:hypothetical protein [Verrucomicrobiae bacterium]